MLLPLDIELEVVEAEKGNEENEDSDKTRQQMDWGGGSPGRVVPWSSPAGTGGGVEGKAPVSAGRSPFEGDSCTKWCIRKVVLT